MNLVPARALLRCWLIGVNFVPRNSVASGSTGRVETDVITDVAVDVLVIVVVETDVVGEVLQASIETKTGMISKDTNKDFISIFIINSPDSLITYL